MEAWKKWALIALSIGLLGLAVYWFLLRKTGKPSNRPSTLNKPTSQLTTSQLNARTMFDRCEKLGFSENASKLIVSVAMHETGNFTSNLYKSNNNYFGMKHPQRRQTTSKGERNGYAFYENYEASIEDFELWFNFHGTSVEEFEAPEELTNFMKEKGYFTDTLENYQTAVVKHFNSL